MPGPQPHGALPFALSFVTFNGVYMSLSYIPYIDHSLANVRATTRLVIIHNLADYTTRGESAWDKCRSQDKTWVDDCQLDSFIFMLSCDKVPGCTFSQCLALGVG